MKANRGVLRIGLLAYLGLALFLFLCFSRTIFTYYGLIIELAPVEMSLHLQAVIMWLFSALTIVALTFDRKKHGDNIPLTIGVMALIVPLQNHKKICRKARFFQPDFLSCSPSR